MWVLTLVLIAVVLRTFVLGLYRVDSASMEPTIHGATPERVLVLYENESPERFDLVVLLREGQARAEVKRAAGLPREQVALEEGDLVINGRRLGPDEPRPEPIPVYEQSEHAFSGAFERPDVPFVEDESGWQLDTTGVEPGAQQGLRYRHPLNDDYLDAQRRRVPGSRAVGDAMVECEVSVRGETGSLAWRLSERGDVFELELECTPSGSVARLRRLGAASDELLAECAVDIAPGRWHELAFSNRDNHLRFDLDGVRSVLAHSYEANRPPEGINAQHRMPRVAFVAQGLVVRLRDVRVLRDLHYTPAGHYGTRGPVQLGPDEVFVLGDNSAESEDGRMWGPVSIGELIGRPLWVVWPLSAVRGL